MTTTTGIYNGHFYQGFDGWEINEYVVLRSCYTECSGNIARISDGGVLQQSFTVDTCTLKFSWSTSDGYDQGYNLYIDNNLFLSKTFPRYSGGIEIIDTSDHIGHNATITFYCNSQYLRINSVETVTYPFSLSIISYPPGAEIYIDDNDTGQTTGDEPTIITTGLTEGPHIVTLKLAGTDHTETVNIVKCQISHLTVSLAGCATFITNPPGAKICIDNVDTTYITPKTLCGYEPNSSHTYSLYFENYRVETDTITFGIDDSIFVDKILTYATGSANFDISPNGAKIIIDNVDTGKVTPNIVDNISTNYHNYEIRLDDYYSLIGSFRSIANQEKLISGSLQQITGVTNGTFDTNLNGWTTTTNNPGTNVTWQNGSAYLYGNWHDFLTIYQDVNITEDALIFDYNTEYAGYDCNVGWSITIDPDTPDATTAANWCNVGPNAQGGRFEADVSSYKGKTARLLFYLNCNIYTHGYGAQVDNVGNVPKPIRSVTFESYRNIPLACPTNDPSMTRCSSDIYIDNNYIGIDPITSENLSIGDHSCMATNQGYLSMDTNSQDVIGNISFSQGVPTQIYVDNIFLPTDILPIEGCTYIESDPPGVNIFIDEIDSGKITPDTICNLPLGNHSYELKLLNHTVYRRTFVLYPQFGKYISAIITGNIYFTSTPSGARIYIDGNDLELNTPYLVKGIKAGYHQYTLTRPYYYDYTNTIYVIGEP